MTKKKILYIVIAVLALAVIGGGLFFFLGNKGAQKETGTGQQTTTSPSTVAQTPEAEKMVDCGKMEDPFCFISRMNGCLPVTAKMMGSDGKTAIEITILGVENEKCHFQRKINNALNLNCFFPKGTMNVDTLDQTFGNDKGLQKVVDDACKPGGW
ncbi:MAG: hypothetical protein Q8N69_00125 [bacterium]|nr:hypothetical protein [bacterium]